MLTPDERRHLPWVLAAALVAALLRVLSPGNGSLWRDEGVLVFLTRFPTLGGMLRFLHEHDSHPPLFHLLMRGWQAVVGSSEAGLAVLTIGAAVALVPLTWFIGSRAFSGPAGLVAAWLVATHPALVYYSPQLRPYSILMLVALVSCYSLWRVADGAGRLAWVTYVASTLAMLLTHNWGWLFLGSQGILCLLLAGFSRTRPARRDMVRIAGAWLAVGLGYLPWLGAFLYQVAHAGHPGSRPGIVGAMFRLTDITLGSPQRRIGLLLAAALVAAVLYRPRPARESQTPSETRALLLLALLPFAVVGIAVAMSRRSDLLVTHTVSTLVPFMALLVAHGITTLARDRRNVAAALCAGAVLGLTGAGATRLLGQVKSNARGVAQAVAAAVEPGDVVIVVPEWIASSFNFYFRLPNQQIVFPTLARVEVPSFGDIYERTADPAKLVAVKDSIDAFRRRGARVWLVEERHWASQAYPDLPDIPKDRYEGYGGADLIRASQIHRHLVSVYGPPDSAAVTPDRRRGQEMLRALLFSSSRGGDSP